MDSIRGASPERTGKLTSLIHPIAWKDHSPKYVCDISHNPVPVSERRGLWPARELRPDHNIWGAYINIPPLGCRRRWHHCDTTERATCGNLGDRRERIRLVQGESETSKTAYLSPTASHSSRRHRRSARLISTPALQVQEECRRGVDGLQPHRRAHWEPEQEVGRGRKSEGGRARTTRGKRRAPGQ